jgi:hypothetical protein
MTPSVVTSRARINPVPEQRGLAQAPVLGIDLARAPRFGIEQDRLGDGSEVAAGAMPLFLNVATMRDT